MNRAQQLLFQQLEMQPDSPNYLYGNSLNEGYEGQATGASYATADLQHGNLAPQNYYSYPTTNSHFSDRTSNDSDLQVGYAGDEEPLDEYGNGAHLRVCGQFC